jgi:hypothetical protein
MDFFEDHQNNLAKILKSYRNHNSTNYSSVVNSVSSLMVNNSEKEFQALDKDLLALKQEYMHTVDYPEEVKINEDKYGENKAKETLNIENIIKTSETEINKTKDQKNLLKSLIDDININSGNKANYDDAQFERNMADIINDTLSNEKENQDEFKQKKAKTSFIFIFFIIFSLSITGYLLKDQIKDLYNNLLIYF